MKIKTSLTLAAVLGALSLTTYAQDGGGPPQDGSGGPGGPGGPGMGGRRHPIPAIVTALDANHDGIIDSNEIANASAALKTLDKNGDGKLTPDEFMGKPPGRPPGGGDGQGGPNDQGGQGKVVKLTKVDRVAPAAQADPDPAVAAPCHSSLRPWTQTTTA